MCQEGSRHIPDRHGERAVDPSRVFGGGGPDRLNRGAGSPSIAAKNAGPLTRIIDSTAGSIRNALGQPLDLRTPAPQKSSLPPPVSLNSFQQPTLRDSLASIRRQAESMPAGPSGKLERRDTRQRLCSALGRAFDIRYDPTRKQQFASMIVKQTYARFPTEHAIDLLPAFVCDWAEGRNID